MSGFFLGWPQWLQLTFVLFCAFAIIIATGNVRNWMEYRRDRKYSALDQEDTEACEANNGSEMCLNELEEYESFGVRALEEGPAVEGIWVSATTTPATSLINISRPLTRDGSAVSESPQPLVGPGLNPHVAKKSTNIGEPVRASPHDFPSLTDLLASTSPATSVSSLTADGPTTQMLIKHHQSARDAQSRLLESDTARSFAHSVTHGTTEQTAAIKHLTEPHHIWVESNIRSQHLVQKSEQPEAEFLAHVQAARGVKLRRNTCERNAEHMQDLFQHRRDLQVAETGDLSRLKRHSMTEIATCNQKTCSVVEAQTSSSIHQTSNASPVQPLRPLKLSQTRAIYTPSSSSSEGETHRTPPTPQASYPSPKIRVEPSSSAPDGQTAYSFEMEELADDDARNTGASLVQPPVFKLRNDIQKFRKVNEGFEVLSRGTVGTTVNVVSNHHEELIKRKPNRLHKPPPRAFRSQSKAVVERATDSESAASTADAGGNTQAKRSILKRARKSSISSQDSADSSNSSNLSRNVRFTL